MRKNNELKKLLRLLLLICSISFSIFVIIESDPADMIQTAHCLAVKESSSGWFTHIIQFMYRVIFETCDHDYR